MQENRGGGTGEFGRGEGPHVVGHIRFLSVKLLHGVRNRSDLNLTKAGDQIFWPIVSLYPIGKDLETEQCKGYDWYGKLLRHKKILNSADYPPILYLLLCKITPRELTR